MFGFTRLTSTIRTAFRLSFFILLFTFGLVKPMGNFFCLVHDRRKGHIIVVADIVKQPFQLHHQAGYVHLAAGRLLQLSSHTLYLGLRSMVPGLQFLTVEHLAQGNVHLVQQLCKEVLDLFHNGLLFFWVRSVSSASHLANFSPPSCVLASPLMKSKIISPTASSRP